MSHADKAAKRPADLIDKPTDWALFTDNRSGTNNWNFVLASHVRSIHVISIDGPSVWTGRALQAESDDLEKLVLRFCIRPIDGAFELLAIMDIRARSISFTSRPRRPYGPPDRERAGETFSPSPLPDLQTSAGKANYYLRRSA